MDGSLPLSLSLSLSLSTPLCVCGYVRARVCVRAYMCLCVVEGEGGDLKSIDCSFIRMVGRWLVVGCSGVYFTGTGRLIIAVV